MNTCSKLLKLLIARKGVSERIEKDAIDEELAQHIETCSRCAELWAGLSRPIAATSAARSPGFGGLSAAVSAEEAGPDRGRYTMVREESIGTETKGRFFTLFVDNVEFRVEESELTGAQIMDLAGIPHDTGLILVEESGTQEQIAPSDTVELKPGRRFKRAPRFVRG